jgi:hypothetical protein
MFILARSGYLTPPWVNYIGLHNSKRHMNQRGCSESVQLNTKMYKNAKDKRPQNNKSKNFPQSFPQLNEYNLDYEALGWILEGMSRTCG